MQTEVKVRERERVVVLVKAAEVRLAQIGRVVGNGIGEAYAFLGQRRLITGEPPFVIYHGMPGPTDLPFEIELCVPLAAPIQPPSGWQCRELEGGTFASVVHVGSYQTIGAAYDILDDWISTHDLRIAGPAREAYLTSPSTPPAETRTVVEFPVTSARIPEPVA